jgi:hypothetical protein
LVIALWGITNIMLLVFAAIIIDEFAKVRQARSSAPSLFDEAADLIGWTASNAMSPSSAVRWMSENNGAPSPRAFGPMGAGVDTVLPTYALIIAAFEEGAPLATVSLVTPDLLAAALGISSHVAAQLIAEMLHASPTQISSGWIPKLSPAVLDSLDKLKTPGLLRAQKSAVFLDVVEAAPGEEASSTLSPGERVLSSQVEDLAALVAAMREELRALRGDGALPGQIQRPL